MISSASRRALRGPPTAAADMLPTCPPLSSLSPSLSPRVSEWSEVLKIAEIQPYLGLDVGLEAAPSNYWNHFQLAKVWAMYLGGRFVVQ
jgi:hypothetical protein